MQFVGVTIVLGTWYTVGVISLYVLLLFRLLRKRGLGDPRLKALFGFVYLRFEERFYWWELLETGRKMMLVIIKVSTPRHSHTCPHSQTCPHIPHT